jgi:hypothetical protein
VFAIGLGLGKTFLLWPLNSAESGAVLLDEVQKPVCATGPVTRLIWLNAKNISQK